LSLPGGFNMRATHVQAALLAGLATVAFTFLLPLALLHVLRADIQRLWVKRTWVDY